MGLTNVNVASLNELQVEAIQKYEQEFKAKYGDKVILIALNDTK